MRSMKNINGSVVTVDLNDGAQCLENLEKAFQIGTFVLKNAPVNFKRLARVLANMDTFYKLDANTKEEISSQTSGDGATRGYFPLGAESGLAEVFEKKESYSFGWPDKEIPSEEIDKLSLVAPNLYPENGCINKEDVDGLIEDFANTAKQLAKLIETILFNGKSLLPVDESSDYQSLLRSFRYYKKNEFDPANTGANSLHTDWNLITLVYTDADGFQYRDDDGKFQNISPETDNCLIVNFGDYLSSLTDGKISSPWHQVVDTKEKEERNSLVFFYYPSASSEAVKNPIYNQGEALSLFVDQSDPLNRLWDLSSVQTMNQMYAEKWKQVSRGS
jgi:isopenicillin N synthase-like dioxygenase